MTPDALSRLATGYWPAAAVNAAVRLGVFDALAGGPLDATAVARSAGSDPDRTAALLDALVAVGLLTKSADRYAIDPAVRPLLARDSPACMLDALAYNDDLYRQWAGLADVVRGDAPAAAGRQLGADPAMTRRFVLGMEAKAAAFAPALADAIDLGDASSLLDVGAGPGTLSRLLAARSPRLAVTLLDLPAVLDVTRGLWAGSPAAARVRFHAADYRRDVLPGGFDAVVYAGALHQETPATAAALVANVRRSLRPGGRAFVIDLMLDDDRTTPAFSALFQLNMMLQRPGSRVFTAGEAVGLLHEAGLVGIETHAVDGTPYRIVSGACVH